MFGRRWPLPRRERSRRRPCQRPASAKTQAPTATTFSRKIDLPPMTLALRPDETPIDVALYDPADVEARLRALAGSDDALGAFLPGDAASGDLARRLRALIDDTRGPRRSRLTADAAMLARLDGLAANAPNLATAANLIARSARLSLMTGAPMAVRPLLLVGKPGVGKTRFARDCASALGVEIAEFSFAQSDDIGALLGHSVAWKGAQIGVVTRTLLSAATASPVIVIDEVDKAPTGPNAVSVDALHTLLEPMTAQTFVDPYLEIPLRADGLIWIATANDITALSPSIVDRFIVLHVQPPSAAQELKIFRSIYREATRILAPGFAPDITDDVAHSLQGAEPEGSEARHRGCAWLRSHRWARCRFGCRCHPRQTSGVAKCHQLGHRVPQP